MRRSCLLCTLLLSFIGISCEGPSATLVKYSAAGVALEEYKTISQTNVSVDGTSPFEITEVVSKPGVSVIAWSISVTNVFQLSREYVVVIEFNDLFGRVLCMDLKKVPLAPGETQVVKGTVEVPTDKAVKIMAARISYSG